MAKKEQIRQSLCHLPRKIIAMRDTDQAATLVLHELCSKNCFDFTKAAYFVDNPDFDCLKGVAGFDRQDLVGFDATLFLDSEKLSSRLNTLPFNQKVRSLTKQSAKSEHHLDNEDFTSLAYDLGIQRPAIFSWDTRHDNHGVLLYEKPEDEDIHEDELHNGLALLSFCPIH
jgi:hypothetical protein